MAEAQTSVEQFLVGNRAQGTDVGALETHPRDPRSVGKGGGVYL